jgi:hypothetical protein
MIMKCEDDGGNWFPEVLLVALVILGGGAYLFRTGNMVDQLHANQAQARQATEKIMALPLGTLVVFADNAVVMVVEDSRDHKKSILVDEFHRVAKLEDILRSKVIVRFIQQSDSEYTDVFNRFLKGK